MSLVHFIIWLIAIMNTVPDYLVFHIEAVSKLLENRNEKDIVKLFGQEESFRSLLKIFSALKVLTRQMEAIRGHTEQGQLHLN